MPRRRSSCRVAGTSPVVPVIAALVVAAALASCGAPGDHRPVAVSSPPTVDPAACPSRPPDPTSVPAPAPSVRPGASSLLVPPGPAVATLCHYGAVGGAGGGSVLARSRVVTGPALRALVDFMDAARWTVVTEPAVYQCPMWDGAEVLAVFVYPSGPDVTVSVDLGGCGFASNGSRTVSGGSIAGRLASLGV